MILINTLHSVVIVVRRIYCDGRGDKEGRYDYERFVNVC